MTTTLNRRSHTVQRAFREAVAATAAVATVALATGALAGCAAPDLGSEAGDLRARLLDQAGVASVRLTYAEPITLDSGKVLLEVAMDRDADPDDLVAVVTTTYTAFSTTHEDEEGDLDVTHGDDVVHLRSFTPRATSEAVESAARDAMKVLGSGPVRAEIMTQDVEASPHAATDFTVTAPRNTLASVLATTDTLQTNFGDLPRAQWRVSGPGEQSWSLRGAGTFPTPEERQRIEDLAAGLPSTATVDVSDDLVDVYLPAELSQQQVVDTVRAQLAVLGGTDRAFYQADQGEATRTWVTRGECYFDTSLTGVALHDALASECSQVRRPEE